MTIIGAWAWWTWGLQHICPFQLPFCSRLGEQWATRNTRNPHICWTWWRHAYVEAFCWFHIVSLVGLDGAMFLDSWLVYIYIYRFANLGLNPENLHSIHTKSTLETQEWSLVGERWAWRGGGNKEGKQTLDLGCIPLPVTVAKRLSLFFWKACNLIDHHPLLLLMGYTDKPNIDRSLGFFSGKVRGCGDEFFEFGTEVCL